MQRNDKMSMIKKFIGASLASLMLCGLLTSCVAKPQEELGTEWEGKESFTPSGEMEGAVADLNARFEGYAENASLAFSQNPPAPDEWFEVEAFEDGVKITAYVGDENIVVIPEEIGGKAVLAIGENAFAESLVRAVKLPDCVKKIEKGAFASCDNLATLYLPVLGDGENSHFGYIFGADSYENHPLSVPASLDMVLLGDGVEEIGENAFAGCKSLSAVVFSDSVKKIGDFAFYECKDLVYIPQTNAIESVGSYAFGGCSSLFMALCYEAESFGRGAFYECNSLRMLGLPFVGGTAKENRYIGYLFGAESVDYNADFVPESLYCVAVSGALEIPDRAFAGCAYIAKFVLADGVESIGVRAFWGCRSIAELSLPDTLKVIGDDAFFGCDNLKTLELGANLESIGMQAFYGCRSLTWVSLPDKVTEIKPSTFALCESLASVELNQVKKIGKDAFLGCDSLKAVDCRKIEVAEGNEALTGIGVGEE